MCACTEPVRTGIVAVCVEYGRPKWPITMDVESHIQNNVSFFIFGTQSSYDPLGRGFFSLENQGKKARFARAPHDYTDQLLWDFLEPLFLAIIFLAFSRIFYSSEASF